jgi:hypothetical protein
MRSLLWFWLLAVLFGVPGQLRRHVVAVSAVATQPSSARPTMPSAPSMKSEYSPFVREYARVPFLAKSVQKPKVRVFNSFSKPQRWTLQGLESEMTARLDQANALLSDALKDAIQEETLRCKNRLVSEYIPALSASFAEQLKAALADKVAQRLQPAIQEVHRVYETEKARILQLVQGDSAMQSATLGRQVADISAALDSHREAHQRECIRTLKKTIQVVVSSKLETLGRPPSNPAESGMYDDYIQEGSTDFLTSSNTADVIRAVSARIASNLSEAQLLTDKQLSEAKDLVESLLSTGRRAAETRSDDGEAEDGESSYLQDLVAKKIQHILGPTTSGQNLSKLVDRLSEEPEMARRRMIQANRTALLQKVLADQEANKQKLLDLLTSCQYLIEQLDNEDVT